jgi:hypothetical protein
LWRSIYIGTGVEENVNDVSVPNSTRYVQWGYVTRRQVDIMSKIQQQLAHHQIGFPRGCMKGCYPERVDKANG